jgi:hypothetical protein
MSSELSFDTWQSTAGVNQTTSVQVVNYNYTSTWSASGSGTSWYDTPLLATITPSKTTSKILVIAKMFLGTQYWEIQGRLTRNGTVIGIGDARGSRMQCGFATLKYDQSYDYYDWFPVSYSYYDSPNTTSPVTYMIQLNPYGGNVIYMNRKHSWADNNDHDGCPSSTITLMEISQ